MTLSWLESVFGQKIGIISIEPFSPASFILSLGPLYFLRKRGRSTGYLLCFYVFSLYAWAALAYTIFEFPVDSIGMIRQRRWATNVNLVPALLTGKLEYSSPQVYGNFLLGIPFGLGLPFIAARSTHKRFVLLGLGFAAGIELVQLLIGLVLYQGPYRVIDIDDVWLVFAGTLVGYGSLCAVAKLYRQLQWKRGAQLPVWSHFHEVLMSIATLRWKKSSRREQETEGPSRPA